MPSHYFFFFLLPQPPTSTLFPYTTLFRSRRHLHATSAELREGRHLGGGLFQHQPGQGDAVHRDFEERCVGDHQRPDRKSTRLNSSHEWISYAVFCLKKKKVKDKEKLNATY